MTFKEPPHFKPAENQEPQKQKLQNHGLETNITPAPKKNVGEAEIVARKKADANKLAELKKEMAIRKLSSEMDELEVKKVLKSKKGEFIERMTNLLRIASDTEDPQSHKSFRNDSHFQKLKIGNKYLIRNSFDRDLHGRIFTYLDNIGIKTTDEEKREIEIFFEMRDVEKRKVTLESYATNGLLTLKSALARGVLKETSSTPGDLVVPSKVNLEEFSNDEFETIRGYELTAKDVNDALFYGSNSFFQVVMERGGEEINRAGQIPKIEVENRLRNSMIFVIKTDKVEISRRTENVHKEDVVGRDIKPEEIDYLIVHRTNLPLAQETFGHLPIKIIEADSTKANMEGLYGGPYTLPNYKDKIDQIAKTENSIWCHIARLPVDTYPEGFAAKG